MKPKIIYSIKKLAFSILLFLSLLNIEAQTKKINLDNDFGFEFARLGENYSDLTKRIELYPFSCNYCEAKDSIAKKYSIKSLDKIQIEGITTDRICKFYFIDNLLYKIEINLPNNDLVQQKLSKFFTEKYGKEDKKNGIIKIWETKNTYLEVYIPNVVNQDNKFSSITIFSKELNEKLNKRLKEGNDNKPEIVSLKNERKGEGNSSFTPDINNTLNLLQKN